MNVPIAPITIVLGRHQLIFREFFQSRTIVIKNHCMYSSPLDVLFLLLVSCSYPSEPACWTGVTFKDVPLGVSLVAHPSIKS